MHRVAIQNLIMSIYYIFISPLLLERITPHFTTMPYLCHCFFAVRTFVNNSFEGWNTERVKFHQKSLTSTLRITTTSTEPDWCINFTKMRSNIPLVLWFCCYVLIKNIFKKHFLIISIKYITHYIRGPRQFFFTQHSPGKPKIRCTCLK